MKGDPLPDSDHVSRYCTGSTIAESGRITAAAFQLRPQDDYLSVYWLEFHKLPNRNAQIMDTRKDLQKTLELRNTGRILVLNVGNTCHHVRRETIASLDIRILHEPVPDASSHSGIFDVDADDIIPELIAETVQEIYLAIDDRER